MIKVDVAMLAYNHEGYINKAIESVLKQKTGFSFRLIIAEDNSTDNTKKICVKYHDLYPEQIELLPNMENLGMAKNFIRLLKACSGKYIALLEGDDYWTDPLKLQKQVDFLEEHSDFSCCAHLSKTIYDYEPNSGSQFYNKAYNQSGVITKNDFRSVNRFHTSSLVFKSEVLHALPTRRAELFRDTPLKIWALNYGNIKVLPEIMSVYRRNKGGVSENNNSKIVYEAELATSQALGEELKDFYFKSLYLQSHWHYFYLSNGANLKFQEKLKLYLRFFIPSFYIFPQNLKQILSGAYKVLM